mgnify:CR=1 FL=1
MTQDKKQILGHVLACGTQIMWGATFVSTKVLLNYFQPVEVLFTRAVLAFIANFLSTSFETEESEAGICICRRRTIRNCSLFHAGKYSPDHDLCVQRRHHRSMRTFFRSSGNRDFL